MNAVRLEGMRLIAATAVGVLAIATLVSPVLAQRAVPRSPVAVPRRDTAVPFKVGETLTFDVSLSSYMVAGTAVSTIRERRTSSSESAAYYIVAEGKPLPLISRLYSLYYKMDTLLDTATLLPQRMTLYSEEGRRTRLGTTRFDRSSRRALFELSGERPVKTNVTVPAQVQDGLSVIYALRAMTLAPGKALTYSIIDEGALYTLSLNTLGSEQVRVPLGDFNAWKLGVRVVDTQGRQIGENMGLWISSDARRLPVKMQADLPVGSVVLALREAQ